MNKICQKIFSRLPYSAPFLFADKILSVSEEKISGEYTFPNGADFYNGHFSDKPVTPGVLLLECTGQIGLVGFGIFLLKLYETSLPFYPVLSNLEADFKLPVPPGETVTVQSEKIYLRKNILKCRIIMKNSRHETVLTTIATCKFIIEA